MIAAAWWWIRTRLLVACLITWRLLYIMNDRLIILLESHHLVLILVLMVNREPRWQTDDLPILSQQVWSWWISVYSIGVHHRLCHHHLYYLTIVLLTQIWITALIESELQIFISAYRKRGWITLLIRLYGQLSRLLLRAASSEDLLSDGLWEGILFKVC